nr:VOC family protein [Alicyclobacillus shizuokensis]
MGILREEWQHLASLSHSSPAGRVISPIDYGGLLHHVEINVSNLECSAEFWGWFLGLLGYQPYQVWEGGRSWRLGETYLVFVQVADPYKEPSFHRRRVGLNHLAFHAASRAQVDQITHDLRARGVRILYEDRHPYAGGTNHYAVFFEDPDRIKVEVVAPEHELGVCMGPAQCTFRNDGFRHRNRVQTTPE